MQRLPIKEHVLLHEDECFSLKTKEYGQLEVPSHFHSEYELNISENVEGARRVIGHHLQETGDKEMVLIGPGLRHCWQNHRCRSNKIVETTLHFQADFFSEKFLHHNEMKKIKVLLANAAGGILFSEKSIADVVPLVKNLKTASGFDSLLLLMRIFHILSLAQGVILSSVETNQLTPNFPDDRIERVLMYVRQNFSDVISLKKAANIANMTEVSFSRFFKQRTGKTFMECVNEIRIDYSSRMLAETTNNIAEIAFASGFNNISNFNRIFKHKKNLTPTQYREVFAIKNIYRMCS